MNERIEQLEQHINQIETEAKKAREELERMKAGDQEWPKIGDAYFSISSTTDGPCESTWDNDSIDLYRLEFGNIFRTKEEYEKEIFARKVVAKLRRQPGARGLVVDTHNYCIEVSFYNNSIKWSFWGAMDKGWQAVYFDSEKYVKNAIAAVGEENILKAATWFAMRK